MSKWMGDKPETCDLCHQKLERVFIDGATAMGPWAIGCEACLRRGRLIGLGTGRGQKYSLETGEKLEG